MINSMMKINSNYLTLNESYLFSTIAKKVNEFSKNNPDKKIIRMGIGDVTRPLCPSVIKAMHSAVDEMGKKDTFRGYGPEQGYDFLKVAIQNYYKKKNVSLEENEIFISDGAKSDIANILDIVSLDNTVMIPNPVYPVYLDTNMMIGRKVVFIDANESNGFLPMPDNNIKTDIIYLCSPNNPTGAVYNRGQLKEWVEYANRNNALILFDAAYEVFITDPNLPASIYEIEGAKDCAIEFCSLSKTAGFTGTRCGYTVVPLSLNRENTMLNKLWLRRQTTKFNGVSYVVQRGAQAVFSDEGQKEIQETIDYYRNNARIMADTLSEMGVWFCGGINSPYIWMKCFNGMDSWDFFDMLLEKICVVGTPGSGFGKNGEGYFRLTAFGDADNTAEAMKRMQGLTF